MQTRRAHWALVGPPGRLWAGPLWAPLGPLWAPYTHISYDLGHMVERKLSPHIALGTEGTEIRQDISARRGKQLTKPQLCVPHEVLDPTL